MTEKSKPETPKQGTYYSGRLPDGREVGGIVRSVGSDIGMDLVIGIQPLGTTGPEDVVEVLFPLGSLERPTRNP